MSDEKFFRGPQPVPGSAPSHRDASQPFNQLRPLSLRTSGSELDECCQAGYQQPAREAYKSNIAEANPPRLEDAMPHRNEGVGTAIRNADEAVGSVFAEDSELPPPMMSKSGESLSRKSGAFVDWKNTKLGGR